MRADHADARGVDGVADRHLIDIAAEDLQHVGDRLETGSRRATDSVAPLGLRRVTERQRNAVGGHPLSPKRSALSSPGASETTSIDPKLPAPSQSAPRYLTVCGVLLNRTAGVVSICCSRIIGGTEPLAMVA